MFFDLLFPSRCVGCGKFGKSLCVKCKEDILPTGADVCPGCFKPSFFGITHNYCRDNTLLDGALSVVQYRGVIRNIIKEAKYRRAYNTLEDFLENTPKDWYEKFHTFSMKFPSATLCPIPLHRIKYNTRGFNQSDILSKKFGKITSLKIEKNIVRVKNTLPQASQKSRAMRRKNIQGAFEMKCNKKTTSTIILVDDLFTSANTANEAARILKINGVKQVYLFVLAHG